MNLWTYLTFNIDSCFVFVTPSAQNVDKPFVFKCQDSLFCLWCESQTPRAHIKESMSQVTCTVDFDWRTDVALPYTSNTDALNQHQSKRKVATKLKRWSSIRKFVLRRTHDRQCQWTHLEPTTKIFVRENFFNGVSTKLPNVVSTHTDFYHVKTTQQGTR